VLFRSVKGNLLREERLASLKQFRSAHFRKVACVMMGDPSVDHKAFLQRRAVEEKHQLTTAQLQANALKRKAEKVYSSGCEQKKRKLEDKSSNEEVSCEQGSGADVSDEGAGEDSPRVAQLVEVEQHEPWLKKTSSLSDVSPFALSQIVLKGSLPDLSEGFDDVVYAWQPYEEAKTHMRRWSLERKIGVRVEDIQPSDWFREKWSLWQNDLQAWEAKHKEYKSGRRHDGSGSVREDSGKDVGDGAGKDGKCCSTNGRAVAKDDMKTCEEDLDYEQELMEETLSQDTDVFHAEHASDIGDERPLFARFESEDWILLNLRFEVHLLVHAFKRDCNDPERTGMLPEHLPFYYGKYYKRG